MIIQRIVCDQKNLTYKKGSEFIEEFRAFFYFQCLLQKKPLLVKKLLMKVANATMAKTITATDNMWQIVNPMVDAPNARCLNFGMYILNPPDKLNMMPSPR